MTGNNILLDTSIVIELFKGNLSVKDSLADQSSINMPFVVLGELYLGAYRSSNTTKHIKQITDLLPRCNILIADDETAEHYAQIKAGLLNKGKPIPENDIWIAATAKQHSFGVVTKDKHFNEIDDITVISWI